MTATLTAEAIVSDPEVQRILVRKGHSSLSLRYDLGLKIRRIDSALTGERFHSLVAHAASFRRKMLLAAAVAERRALPSPPAPAVLYRHFSADGALLYIGPSQDAHRRMREHRLCSPWAGLIARVETVDYPSRREAARAERKAIRDESPIHNVERYGAKVPAALAAQVPA